MDWVTFSRVLKRPVYQWCRTVCYDPGIYCLDASNERPKFLITLFLKIIWWLDHSSWLSSNSLLWRLLNATERKGRRIHINLQTTARFTDDCELGSVHKDYHYNGELLNGFWSLLFLPSSFKSCLTSYIFTLCLLSYFKKQILELL